MRMEDIWWKRLSNPVELVNRVTDLLLDNTSVAVVFDGSLPWKETFIETIAQEIEIYSADRRIKSHTLSADTDPGEFLLQKYCSRDIQREYWPTESKARFLAEHQQIVLNKSYVFINLDGDSANWLSFIKEYTACCPEDGEHGLFVLLTADKKFVDSQKKTAEETDDLPLQFLDYDEYVHDYDAYILCMMLLSQKNLGMPQQYLSELAVALAENNVVLAAELADRGEALAIDPQKTFQETVQSIGIRAEHSPSDIHHAIWQAQMKILFPILEQFRCQLFKTYQKEITDLFYLPRSGTFDCETPDELEIGQLQFLLKNKRVLSIPDYESLCHAREARNCLAHLNYLPYQKFKPLLHLHVKGKDGTGQRS